MVVLEPKCHHTEVVHHNDMTQKAQIMYHIQKKNLKQVYSMVVHMHGVMPHRTVAKEEVHCVAEMVAGGDWEDNSEKEHKVVPLQGDLVKIVAEVDLWVKAMAAAEVDEVLVLAEGTVDEGSVDIVDLEVPRAEDVAAEIKVVGIADLGFPEMEQVVLVGSMDLSEEQLGFGSEGKLEVANPVGGDVERVH